MAAIYSNVGNRWNILGFNFTKGDALSSVYKISMASSCILFPQGWQNLYAGCRLPARCHNLKLFDWLCDVGPVAVILHIVLSKFGQKSRKNLAKFTRFNVVREQKNTNVEVL
jgi:hypothetical protein